MSNLRMGLCGKLAKIKHWLIGVRVLRWIATYSVDKVIRPLNNWDQADRNLKPLC